MFPMALVKKKDGSMRMCINYHQLNAIAAADAYPIPHVDDMINSLGKAKYITILDSRCRCRKNPNLELPSLPLLDYFNFG